MAFNREFEVNENQVADLLKSATEKVRTTENIEVLADLSKLFKKNVPLTVRKYVIAYLLKDALKHNHSFGNNRRNDRNERNEKSERAERSDRNNRNRNEYKSNRAEKPAPQVAATEAGETPAEERPRHPRVEIAPENATSIFISIGKNRRVYPRDLVGILIAIAGLDRDRIGDIKVLANYSFVQLYTEDAQIAIDKLNGYDYRGRKLAVSYSKQKSEEEGTEAEVSETADKNIDSGYEAPFADSSMSESEMEAEDAAAYAAAEKAAADKTPFGV